MKDNHYDAIIIGFGKGGKTLASKLAASGKRVAMIEMDKGMYGGTCINVGCIPSKSLVTSASRLAPGLKGSEQDDAYRKAIEEKTRLTAMLRQKNYDNLAKFDHATIYDGVARFVGAKQLEVKTNDDTLLMTGEKIFINTGAAPRIPDIPGIRETPGVYTSEGLMALEELPRELVIIGAGYIGLEFASMYAAFGSRVTVIQHNDAFLPREDEDVAAEIKKLLEAQGIQFLMNTQTTKVSSSPEGPILNLQRDGQDTQINVNAVLIATGRVPNTAALNCKAAGIALEQNGAVKTDAWLRSTAPDVWALGDAAGSAQHTYISLDDYRIVWSQLEGPNHPSRDQRTNVPYSVFLRTPYARVGMNEREAEKAGRAVRIAKLPVAAIPKAQVLQRPDGFLKAVMDADSNQILGAMLLCEESFEVINIIKLAIDYGADAATLRDQIFTHPTMSEALNDLFAG